jgi:hypothetical protein
MTPMKTDSKPESLTQGRGVTYVLFLLLATQSPRMQLSAILVTVNLIFKYNINGNQLHALCTVRLEFDHPKPGLEPRPSPSPAYH